MLFISLEISSNLFVRISEVDRGCAPPRNVLGVVMSFLPSGLNQLGNEKGFKRVNARNQFIIPETKFIDICGVTVTSLTLRSAFYVVFRKAARVYNVPLLKILYR